MPSRASRDLGIRRISVSTRLLAGGSLLAGGVLSVAVAQALPGKASHPRTTGTVAPSESSPSGVGTSGSESTSSTTAPSSTLTSPAESPQAATGNPPVVSSGGS